VKQGDIYWYTFHAPDKRRPVLILTRDSAIVLLTSVTIAPLTTKIRDIGSEVLLTMEEDGVPGCAWSIPIIFKRYARKTLAHSLRGCHECECSKFVKQSSFLWDLMPWTKNCPFKF
jgi:hypothetical protein